MTLSDKGNVGISTINPTEKLDVDGQIRMRPGAGAGRILVSDAQGVGFWTPPAIVSDGDWTISGNDLIQTNTAGKVIVGLEQLQPASPHFTDYKMSVDGKFVSRKLISTDLFWADDEFEKELKMDDLDEEMEFAFKYSHFKDMPSAEDLKVSGIDHGEMSALQMRLIERLYKYMYLMKKENRELKDRIAELEKNK